MARRSSDWLPVAVLGSVVGVGAGLVAVGLAVARWLEARAAVDQEAERQEGRTERTGGILGFLGNVLGTVVKVVV